MNKFTETHDENRYCYKVLFKVQGKLALIHALIKNGMIIKMDPDCQYACACFDNTIEFNNFKEKIEHISLRASV